MGQAQVWCPPGATWWYDYHTNVGGTGYAQVAYVGDTVIAGMNSQKLSGHVVGYDQYLQQPIDYNLTPLYTALVGEVVALWDGTAFDTLFRYQAVPGDQWLPTGNSTDGTIFTVTDTGSMSVDGIGLRWWAVDLGSNMNVTIDTIFERLGGLHVFLRPSVILDVTDPVIWDLRCYTDQDINYTTGIVPACDFILAIEPNGSPPRLALFPNPASSSATLVWKDPGGQPLGSANLDFLNAQGSIVRNDSLDLSGGKTLIELHGLPPGLFTLRLKDPQGRWSTTKLVVD